MLRYDAESNFRNLDGITAFIAKAACICLSLFHVYTAGFGLLNEVAHSTVHLSFVLGLVFLIFPRRRNSGKISSWVLGFGFCALYFFLIWQLTQRLAGQIQPWAVYSLFGVTGLISITALPLEKLQGFSDRLSFFDWPLAIAGAEISLYLVVFFKSIFIENIGFPKPAEFIMGLLASHFFVFYYGVLADVTPPVALAAYAGAGIARSDPMATGFTAFKLSMGKGLVPFMFVYAPSMLLINFTWTEFSIAMASGILGIFLLSVAFTGHFMRSTKKWENLLLCISGLLLVGNYLPFILMGTTLGLILIGRIYLTCRQLDLDGHIKIHQ